MNWSYFINFYMSIYIGYKWIYVTILIDYLYYWHLYFLDILSCFSFINHKYNKVKYKKQAITWIARPFLFADSNPAHNIRTLPHQRVVPRAHPLQYSPSAQESTSPRPLAVKSLGAQAALGRRIKVPKNTWSHHLIPVDKEVCVGGNQGYLLPTIPQKAWGGGRLSLCSIPPPFLSWWSFGKSWGGECNRRERACSSV